MTLPSPRPDPWRRRLSPERIAAVIAAVVVALGTLAVASTIGASEGGAPRATLVPGDGTPRATPHPFVSSARFVLKLHERLAEDQVALGIELEGSDFDSGEVIAIVRRLNGMATVCADSSLNLARAQGSREVGRTLGTFYADVVEAAGATLREQVRDAVAVRAAAERLMAVLEPTAALQQSLERLIASALVTPSVASIPPATPGASDPGPSLTPSPASAVPTPGASPNPTGTPAESPATARPSRLPLVGPVLNPGFEDPGGDPWSLVVQSPAAATFTVDTTTSHEGGQSGRVDIIAPSEASTGIALRQTGIELAQGHRYRSQIALRAEVPREVQVRVTSAAGATYGTRVLTVGPDWTAVDFEFGAFVHDPAAILEIDLGRSTTTTWVDAAQIRDVSAFAP